MKIRALSSFSHPQEGARAEGLDTKRRWIPMDSHRRASRGATQTRLPRLAHVVKCRRQRSSCIRQQFRREAQPPYALPHHFQLQALGSENLNRLKLLLCTAAVLARWARQKRGARRGVDLRRVRGLLTLSNFPPEALRSCRGAAVRPEARERRQRPGLPLAPPRLRPTPFSRV